MRIVAFFVVLTCYFLPGIAITPDSLFERANYLYAEEKYEEAAQTYLDIIKQGYTSYEVLYNLGNSYFRSNKFGKARLFYEKALLLSPGDPSVGNNLALTESLLRDQFDEVPVFFLRTWIISIRKFFTPGTWSVLTISVFSVSFILLVFFLFSKRVNIKKLSFFSGIILFFVSVIFMAFAFASSKYLHNSGTAIITVPSVIVKSAPRESGKELFIIHEGAKVWLENNSGDWQEIKSSDGRIGWLPSSSIEKI